jgi:hypothetical protein
MPTCKHCGVEKPEDQFAPSHLVKSKMRCRPCNTLLIKKWRHANGDLVKAYHRKYHRERPDIYRNSILKAKYGIGIAEFDQMHINQGGVCAICGQPEKSVDRRTKLSRNLSVDHCHNKGHVRGLLCGTCNPGLGHFKHDEGLLMKAIEYLRKTAK